MLSRKKLFKHIALALSIVLLLQNFQVGKAEGISLSHESLSENSLFTPDMKVSLSEDFRSDSILLNQEKAWINQELDSRLSHGQQRNAETLQMEQEIQQEQPSLQESERDRDLTERITRIKNMELEQAWAKQNEESANRSIETLAEELNLEPAFIQELLDSGKTLEEIERERRKPKDSLLDETLPLFSNRGLSVLDSVYNDTSVSNSVYAVLDEAAEQMISDAPDVDLTVVNTFRERGLPPQPEEPKLDMLKVKLDEAPYRVEVDEESVSTVSGSLSLTEDDLTLPGRGGQGFTLTRSYDSGSSQLFDMDVDANSVDYYDYYAVINYDAPVYETRYTITYNTHVLVNKYKCNTGEFVTTTEDYYSPVTPITEMYTTSAVRDYYFNTLSVNSQSAPSSCSQGFYYIYKYFFSGTTGTATVNVGTESYSDYMGPYVSMSQAQSVAASYSAGQSYSGGTVTGTGIDSDYVGSSTWYMNALKEADTDKRFPIGKGWTWDIPYLTFEGGTYLHMAGGGTYKVENGLLKGYPWKDLTLAVNTSVTVNGVASAQELISITGDKTYFSADGRVIQMSDAYGNNTQFMYSNISPYGTVLTKISDAIGNSINIAYTTSQVTLTMGDR